MEPAAAAWREAVAGRLPRAAAVARELAGAGGVLERAWASALDAVLWTMAAAHGRPALAGELTELVGLDPAACEPVSLAADQMALDATLRFDARDLHAWASVLSCLAGRGGAAVAVRAKSAEAWLAVLEGRHDVVEAIAETMSRDAADLGVAAVVIDASAQRALAALGQRRYAEALAHARRASRMARTEGLLQQEYTANLVLARVRRHGGRAHLAARILEALSQVVPAPWRTWIGWELLLAGGGGLAAVVPAALRAQLGGSRDLADELDLFLAMVDPEAPIPPGAAPWVWGSDHVPPTGIRDASAEHGAYVVTSPVVRARRVLPAGVSAFDPGGVAVRLDAAGRAGARTQEAVAVLALAGENGVGEDALFQRVYGFAYDRAVHGGVLRGLLHRARGALGDAAVIDRVGEDHLRLRPAVPIVVADPRCAPSLEEQVLQRLATSAGRATAREIARAMGIPLRTVQQALGNLVDEGACHAEPDGRRVEYVVEDTTFGEPTLPRLRASVPPASNDG